MPTMTYDGRSFMLDGRRVWITSGAIHYSRVPRAHWAERIALAKRAGLNTIETPIFWSVHEPRPGALDFTGDNDLRAFVQLVGEARMYCILRVGPYIGSGWDMGGLPPWLLELPAVRLRTNSQPFLDASSRFLTALVERIRDLQITSPGGGGPIILVQNESHWTCGKDDLADAYLGELHRYLREAGMNVPTIGANNLWPEVESEIDCWSGSTQMLATMRQLAAVHPNQPRLAIDFSVTRPDTVGAPAVSAPDPMDVQRRLVEILAGGAQFNIDPFHGGSNFGFRGGKVVGVSPGFVAQSCDRHAPIAESGRPGPCFEAVRRIATFSTQFGRVLAHLDPDFHPAGIDPEAAENTVSIVHRRGSQGDVVFVFGPAKRDRKASTRARILLTDGTGLDVDLGSQSAAWVLLDTHLGGRTKLDYCSLNAFALVGKAFVCFGAPGAPGAISVNGSPIEVTVPRGKKPDIIEHESLAIVVCAEEHLASLTVLDDAVLIGALGIDASGKPILPAGHRDCIRVDSSGQVQTLKGEAAAPRTSRAPHLAAWECASLEDYVDGSSARYAAIDGPGDLARLGAPTGYGWYRIALKAGATRKVHAMAPRSGDRLHFFADGVPAGVLGVGPGATPELGLGIKKGSGVMVVLADNMGRYASGAAMGEPKGLVGHLWNVSHIKGVKPKLVSGPPIEPLGFKAPLWELREGDTTDAQRVTWAFAHRKKSPIILTIRAFPGRGLLLVNDAPIAFLETGFDDQILIEEASLSRGNNSIQVALLADSSDEPTFAALVKAVGESLTLADAEENLTAKAEWAYAKWEPPAPTMFGPPKSAKTNGTPTWWRSHFNAPGSDEPLFLDLAGLTKGQVYVNGRHLGRYFVATADHHAVPPQSRIFIPGGWLEPGHNEIFLFDEHGANPSKTRLVLEHA